MCPFTTASSYTQLKGIKNPGGLLSKLPRYLIYRGCKRAICLGIRLNNCLLPLRPLRIVVDSIALTHNDHMITIRFNNWLIKSYFWKLKKKLRQRKKIVSVEINFIWSHCVYNPAGPTESALILTTKARVPLSVTTQVTHELLEWNYVTALP